MTEPSAEPTAGATGWVQDQVYDLKAQVAQIGEQVDHLQSMATQLNETLHTVERSLKETAKDASRVSHLQDELNQAAALIAHLQDQQAESTRTLELLGRKRDEGEGRDQEEFLEVVRRLEQLERRVAMWQDRQAGVDEVGRRFQAGLSVIDQRLQQIEQRLDSVESKAGRGLEGANRAEHSLGRVEGTIAELRRESEAVGERANVAADTAHRLETGLSQQLQELQRLELLAERIELHRAERQRLEDRALRLEEQMRELLERAAGQDDQQTHLRSQQQGLGSHLDALEERIGEQRTLLLEQLRQVIGSQERTKRRQVQELEREVREMQRYVAGLADQ